MNAAKEIGLFLHNMRTEGVWYAITGKHLGAWSIDLLHSLIEFSDSLVIVALVLVIFSIGGSKKARKGLYWTFFIYVILKLIGVSI